MRQRQGGFVLVSMLIATLFVMFAGAATAQLATNNYRASTLEQSRINAQFAADAGLESAMQEVNADHEWEGSSGEVELFENDTMLTTYETTVTDDEDDNLRKYITVTGRTYEPKDSPTPRVERTYTISVRGITAGNFSVVTGVGGLRMTNNAKIIGGNLFVNGEIFMSNSAQIGLASNPIEVRVAHQNCPNPPNGTYPRVCGSGESGQPIAIHNNARIYGEVMATNQTDGNGMLSPGLVSGSPSPQGLPSHDRAAQVAAVSSEQTGNQASCSGSQTKTWPANLKINGNVTLSNTCQIVVEGNVWITGSLNLSNATRLQVANGVSTPPAVMIDSQNGLTVSNNTRLASNNANIGFRMITYWSAASCSPDCADVTGSDLYNGRNTTTITLGNNAEGPHTEFYARWSRVQLSNGGNIGALVGQTVELNNSAAVTFGAEVTGIGGVVGWLIDSYKRDF
jgi:hypothetical protein